MSFILDALRKSDKKRQETVAPGLDAVHDPVPQPRRRPLWLYLLIAVLLLNVGLLVWFFSADQQAPVVDAEVVQPQPAVEPVAPAPVVRPQPQAIKQSPPQVTAPKPVPQIITPKPVPQAAPVEPDRAETGRRIYLISELPVAVQRRIPELHMSLHAYGSDQEGGFSGMVRVNEQILRPGSELEGNLLLEEIRGDGAVFRFEGYLFLLPRN